MEVEHDSEEFFAESEPCESWFFICFTTGIRDDVPP